MWTAGTCFGYSNVTIVIIFHAVSGHYIGLTTVITYIILVLVKGSFFKYKIILYKVKTRVI